MTDTLTHILYDEIDRLKADVQKWIKIAGENQKSANKSAEWAEKQETENTHLKGLLAEAVELCNDPCNGCQWARDIVQVIKKVGESHDS